MVQLAGTSVSEPIAILDPVSLDFGDAPDSYHTLAASNGPRHGILTNTAGVADFRLGATITRDQDGQPSATANADMGDDGVAFVGGGVTPGTNGQVLVTVTTGAHSPGKLQGWIDFNGNGVFDASEKILSNVTLASGAYTLSFPVPPTAKFGATFARFRYGYETDLGPTGSSIAGEVEDYQVTVLPAIPIANPDVFPLPGQPPIRQGSTNNVLDVLANDTATVFGPPDIVPGSFPAQLASGSTLTEAFNATLGRNVLLYTPAANLPAPSQETFTYRVTDGHSVSSPGQVTVNVSPLVPITIDDTFTEPASTTGPVQDQLHVMANDLFGFSDTRVVTLTPVTPNNVTVKIRMEGP